jgi:hypothetical protein
MAASFARPHTQRRTRTRTHTHTHTHTPFSTPKLAGNLNKSEKRDASQKMQQQRSLGRKCTGKAVRSWPYLSMTLQGLGVLPATKLEYQLFGIQKLFLRKSIKQGHSVTVKHIETTKLYVKSDDDTSGTACE